MGPKLVGRSPSTFAGSTPLVLRPKAMSHRICGRWEQDDKTSEIVEYQRVRISMYLDHEMHDHDVFAIELNDPDMFPLGRTTDRKIMFPASAESVLKAFKKGSIVKWRSASKGLLEE